MVSSAGSYFYIADMMLSVGNFTSGWTPAPTEIYTDSVKIDGTGVRVDNSVNTAILNTSEFSVYHGDTSSSDNKIFGISEGLTSMQDATVSNSLQIGRGKFVAVQDGVNFILLD